MCLSLCCHRSHCCRCRLFLLAHSHTRPVPPRTHHQIILPRVVRRQESMKNFLHFFHIHNILNFLYIRFLFLAFLRFHIFFASSFSIFFSLFHAQQQHKQRPDLKWPCAHCAEQVGAISGGGGSGSGTKNGKVS